MYDAEGQTKFVWKILLIWIPSRIKASLRPNSPENESNIAPEARCAAGISDTLLRLSIGLESETDLLDDTAQGFDVVKCKNASFCYVHTG